MYGDNAYRGQKTDPRQGAAGKGLHQRAGTTSQRRAGRRSQTGKKRPHQVKSAGKGRPCVCRGQATVRLQEGALSRAGQQCQPCAHGAGINQHLPGTWPAEGRCARSGQIAGRNSRNRPKRAMKTSGTQVFDEADCHEQPRRTYTNGSCSAKLA